MRVVTIAITGLLLAAPAAARPTAAPGPSRKLTFIQKAKIWAAPVRVRSYRTPGAFSVTQYGIDNGRKIVKKKFRQLANGNQVTVRYGEVKAGGKSYKRIQTTLKQPDGTTRTTLRVPGLTEPQRRQSKSRYSRKSLLGQRARAVAESPLPYFAVTTVATGGAFASAAAGEAIILGAGAYLCHVFARASREMLKPSRRNLDSY